MCFSHTSYIWAYPQKPPSCTYEHVLPKPWDLRLTSITAWNPWSLSYSFGLQFTHLGGRWRLGVLEIKYLSYLATSVIVWGFIVASINEISNLCDGVHPFVTLMGSFREIINPPSSLALICYVNADGGLFLSRRGYWWWKEQTCDWMIIHLLQWCITLNTDGSWCC